MYDDMWWRLLVILSWLIELLYTQYTNESVTLLSQLICNGFLIHQVNDDIISILYYYNNLDK